MGKVLAVWEFDNTLYYTKDNGLAYIASQDDSLLPGSPGYDAHIKAINEGFDRESINGLLRSDRITEIYSERIDYI